MSRFNFIAISADPDNAKAIGEAAAFLGCTGSVVDGDMEAAATLARDWTVAPGCIILDLSQEEDPEGALRRVAGAAPAGETSLVIIGAGDDVASYRRFRQMGASEYLASPVSVDQMVEVFTELQKQNAKRDAGVDHSKIIAVCGARGGTGTSLVAASLAYGLAKTYRRKTLLIDLDLESGCQYVNFNVDPTAGFAQMLVNPDAVDTLILNRTLAAPEPNLVLLSDSAPIDSGIDPTAARTLVEHASRDLDYVVVDLPIRSPFTKSIIEEAGTLVVVATPTLYGLRDALTIFDRVERLDRANVCANPILVINRTGEAKTGTISTQTFRQKAAHGANPDFRKRLEQNVIELPYQPKTAMLSIVRNQSCLDDNGPLGKALRTLLERMPGAPKKRSPMLSRLFGA